MKPVKPNEIKFLVYMKSPEGQFEHRFVEIVGNDLYVSKQGKKPTFVNCLKGCYTQTQLNYSLRIPGDDQLNRLFYRIKLRITLTNSFVILFERESEFEVFLKEVNKISDFREIGDYFQIQ